jgi:hyperosmotically inducible periplasmic protein
MTTFSTVLKTSALTALITFALAGAASAMTAPSDAWITTKVKLSMATTEGVSSTDVNVDTVNKQVTLHGIVNTPAEKEAAEKAAKTVDGVASVRNLLQVVPAKREAKIEAKDDDISRQVTTALNDDTSLKDSSISVQSVNKGVVILKGNATSLSDHLTAVQLARSVPGVQHVASEIETPNDQVAETSIWKDTKDTAKSTTQNARGATTDLYVTSMVKSKLLANSETPAMDINVDSRDGVVTLFGMVPTAAAKAEAERVAKETGGVRSVKNQLEVVASNKQPAVKANDNVVTENVKQSLQQHSELKDVDIEVKNCVARLTGTVSSGIDRVEALQVARATSGVCAVKDDLTIQ